jgi:3-hydroxybutyryl-CoA dehydrogenase
MTEIRKIGVIGAGTMGSGIAQVCAMAGYPVVMQDLSSASLDRARSSMQGSLARLVKKASLTEAQAAEATARIVTTMALDQLADCDIVIEAIVERLDVKAGVLKQLDGICRVDAVFASNTSSISLTELAAASTHPGRVVGMHFFNPVPVMQLVEIIRALQTTDPVAEAVTDLTRAIGKTPRVSKDSYGFIVNRLLAPQINEAINCVYEGLATPEDIDSMMKLGANHPMGPLALGDLIGPADHVGVLVGGEELARPVNHALGEGSVPGPDGHVGDGVVVTAHETMIGQMSVEHIQFALHFHGKAVDGVFNFGGGIGKEMPKATAQVRCAAHLPHQPRHALGALDHIGGEEGFEFFGQVKQDGARFKHANVFGSAAIK